MFSLFKSKYFVKREIPIEKITAITMSTVSQEFVIHVPKEYDYRFSTDFRDNIMLAIV